jgi:putative flippase GtrA
VSIRFARFVVVGAANTAASYGVYLLLLLVVDYRVAYSVAYVAGLLLGYWAHATFVFDARLGVRSGIAYVFTYAAMYVLSLGVLAGAVDWLGIPKPAAMLAALCVTVPASFLLLRRGFRPQR